MPDTAGNRSPLRIPFTFQKRGNTDLLTCVRERIAPAPTSYLLTGLPRNGWLSPRRKIASAWSHAHSTVSCRPSGLLPGLPCSRSVAGSACITVSQYSVFRGSLSVWNPTGVKGAPFTRLRLFRYYLIRSSPLFQASFQNSAAFSAKNSSILQNMPHLSVMSFLLRAGACMAAFHAFQFQRKKATGPAAVAAGPWGLFACGAVLIWPCRSGKRRSPWRPRRGSRSSRLPPSVRRSGCPRRKPRQRPSSPSWRRRRSREALHHRSQCR